MGYRIEYSSVKKIRGVEKRKSRVAALTAMFFLLFLIIVNYCWAEGAAALKDLLFIGDTAAVLDAFAAELQDSDSFAQALSTFWEQVTVGA